MKTEKKIMYDDKNAARYVTSIKGWVDINNRYYGDNQESEHMARWSSCTHKKCACGNIMSKGYSKCEECRNKETIERYNKLQYQEYNGELVYSHLADKYFANTDEIEDYCFDEDLNFKDLRLVFCKPNYFDQVDSDLWDELLPEDSDGELPNKLQEALDSLNKVISELPPASYSPGDVRTEYTNNK